MRVELATVVVSDMAAGRAFYGQLLGYEAVGEGEGCTLLRQRLRNAKPAVVRLVQAPEGAGANRPSAAASILDPGLAALELLTPDDGEAFNALTAAGTPTLSWPQFYRRDRSRPGPTAIRRSEDGGAEYKTFTAIGPGGEALFISRGLSQGGRPWPAWREPDSRFAGGGVVLSTRDRWPIFDVYAAVFGAEAGADQFLQQDPLNVAIGAPPGTYFRFGGLGGSGLYWREFRGVEPPPTPPWPTSLERTGLAMATVSAPDLGEALARAKAAGIDIVSETALPVVGDDRPDGFRLRGAVGELIEVVDARA